MDLELPGVRYVPLVRFIGRAPTEEPIESEPWIDDRAPATSQPVVSMVENDTITIKLQRLFLGPDVPIRVASDNALVEVVSPEHGHITSGDAVIQLRSGSSVPDSDEGTIVRLDVHCASKNICSLNVLVLKMREVRVTPHLVKVVRTTPELGLPDGYPDAPPIEAIISGINGYYRRVGIRLVAGDLVRVDVLGARSNALIESDACTELNAVVRRSYQPHRINMYFYEHIRSSSHLERDSRILGRNMKIERGALQNCLIAKVASGVSITFVTTLAHEIGHFLGLRHTYEPGDVDPCHPMSEVYLMHYDATLNGGFIPLKWVGARDTTIRDMGHTHIRSGIAAMGLTA